MKGPKTKKKRSLRQMLTKGSLKSREEKRKTARLEGDTHRRQIGVCVTSEGIRIAWKALSEGPPL